MKISIVPFMLVISMTLTGCASMSSNECAFSDWRAVGYEDGAQGATSEKFGDYRSACAKHGISADFDAWQSGRTIGLEEFCQPERGFTLGENGRRYYGVCPSTHEGEFLDAYRMGSQLHSLRSEVNVANSRLNANARAIDRLDKVMKEKAILIVADDTPALERVALLAEMTKLSEQKGELEQETEVLIAQRTEAEIALSNYEASLLAYGY